MKQLPKIARDKLAAQQFLPAGGESGTNAAPHLDANLVAAFVEHALGPVERTKVLDHLAKCSECRAEVRLVKSISATDSRTVQTAPTKAQVEPSRWRWMLRWEGTCAGAAAALVIIAFWVSMRPVSAPRSSVQAMIARSAGPSAVAPAMLKTEANELRSSARSVQRLTQLQSATKPVPAKKFLSNGALDANFGNTGASVSQVQAGSAAINAAQPEATEALTPSPQASTVSAAVAPPPATLRTATPAKTAAAPTPPTGTTVATKASEAPYEAATIYLDREAAHPVPASASKTAPLRRMTAFRAAEARAVQPDVRWATSDSAVPGIVEKSVDGGRTWQDVIVAAGVKLRAAFAVGQNVWAGGAAGSLFYSGDGGQQWSAITVSNRTGALSSDVIEIQFVDAAHGWVRASNGERWITSDGGQHWQQAQ